jgi:hypothetical protein
MSGPAAGAAAEAAAPHLTLLGGPGGPGYPSSAVSAPKGAISPLGSETAAQLGRLLDSSTMGKCRAATAAASLQGSSGSTGAPGVSSSGGGMMMTNDPEELLDALLDDRDELSALVRRMEPRWGGVGREVVCWPSCAPTYNACWQLYWSLVSRSR